MARTRNDDKILDTEAISTESEVTGTDVDASDDVSVATSTVDETITSDDSNIAGASVTEDETDDDANVSDTDDNTAKIDEEASNNVDESTDDAIVDETVDDTASVAVEPKVRSTNRLMKVYANASEKSKFHHFVGTYTITGVVKGNFKQIICNVPGIGKFTGYLLSR